MIAAIELWLKDNTAYPSLVVAGATLFLAWLCYEIAHYRWVTRKEKWRVRLIVLLHGGVDIRNRGRLIVRQADAARWINESNAWEGLAFDEIVAVDRDGAEDFRLLDVLPPPRLGLEGPITEHASEYQRHDFRLVKLRRLIRRHRKSVYV